MEKYSPTEWSMTDYFNVMSLGKLKFTGQINSITAPQTRSGIWIIKRNQGIYMKMFLKRIITDRFCSI
jgi:hypothetical protein